MKTKILSLTALAIIASLASCTSNEEIAPEKGYGYIALEGVTTDATIVETRATTTENLTGWKVSVTAKGANTAAWTGNATDLSSQKFEEKTENNPYTVAVYNYEDLAAALNAKSYWGDRYYTGSNTVSVAKGKTTGVTVNCETAKNARLGVSFDDSFTDVVKEGYAMHVTKNGVTDGLTFNAGTASQYVYYTAGEVVTYTLTYTLKDDLFIGVTPRDKTISSTVTIGANGTQKTLNVLLNSMGKISLTIQTTDFDNSPVDITIDALTGDKE